jgi:hypothetical protein
VPDDIVMAADAFFGHQWWIGGHSVQDTQAFSFFDLCEIGSVYEKFHGGIYLK